jgi:hypothetical protein
LQFIAGEIIGQTITGGFMKKTVSVLTSGIRKVSDLANKHLHPLWMKTRDSTIAVNRGVTGMARTGFRNA